jgi:uncharacterized protein (DUF433 family)
MTTLTTGEAAFVAEVSIRTVHQAIDRGEIQTPNKRRRRELGVPEVLYLRMRRDLSRVLVNPARKALYQALRAEAREKGELRTFRVLYEVGPVQVEVGPAVRDVAERLRQLEVARAAVVRDEQIRGGEPVVKGTRIPVHMLADLVGQGASTEELLADYPALSAETLSAALIFAETHPKRGRKPVTPPWRRQTSA